jgi:hypothetical protein
MKSLGLKQSSMNSANHRQRIFAALLTVITRRSERSRERDGVNNWRLSPMPS